MIFLKVSGGLGNQLFQYAAALKYSIFHKMNIKLDLSDYSYNSDRCFSLPNIIDMNVESCSCPSYSSFLSRCIFKLLVKLSYLSGVFYSSSESRSLSCLKSNIHLYGYWQNYEFIKSVLPVMRANLSLNVNSLFLDQIKSSKFPVCVHVRRGDYFSTSSLQGKYGVCTEDYYLRSINHMASIINDPHFYLFSDDVEWVEAHLLEHIRYPTTIIKDKNLSDWQELLLMSNCKAHIISNSTFSWWGATLADSPTVIAPSSWFVDVDRPELIPQNWIRL